jgi:methionyl-tRNA formyltransferase
MQDMFLSNLKALDPELCITAAYGNILPSKFLNIPPSG